MINYIFLVVSVLLAVVGQLFMKKGMMVFGTFSVTELLVKIIPIFLNPFVFTGLVFFGLSSIAWLVVLSRLPLSLVYPMVSVAYVLVALFSWLVFKETVSVSRWVGIFVIIAGVILISRS